MTLPKQKRTENKGIGILLLVETHLALSKTIQNHDADLLHWLSGAVIVFVVEVSF
jgi:hypothetical protein